MKSIFYLTTKIQILATLVLGFVLITLFTSEVSAQPCDVQCPTDFVVNLNEGACEATVFYQFIQTGNCDGTAFTFTQSNDLNTLDTFLLNCATDDNYYYRVFDLPAMGQTTDLNVSNINIGVYETFNNPNVTINIYALNGVLGVDTLSLLGTNTIALPSNLSEIFYPFPITATVDSDFKMVVEIITPGSIFGGNILATNLAGETAPSYYRSPACGVNNISAMSDFIVMDISGLSDDVKVKQTDNSGYTLGEAFPVGTTALQYSVFYANGGFKICDFNVEINPFGNPIGAMACNNLVQISLDENCEAFVGADLILEGGSYSCYADYTIHITDSNGYDIGNHLTSAQVGKTLVVTVEGPNGNSCWGEIFVEDKIGPDLECIDIYTTCATSIEPGSNIATDVTFTTTQTEPISNGLPNQVKITIPVFGLTDAHIVDLNVKLDIEHSNLQDLKVTLESPSGSFVNLFTNPTSGNIDPACTHDNMKLTLDDEASNPNAMLSVMCLGDTYVIDGSFQSEHALNVFDGEDPEGDWILTINDLTLGEGGTFNNAKLVIRQNGAKVSLPIPAGATYYKTGDNSYSVTGLDLCGKTTLTYDDDVQEQSCNSPYSEIVYRTWGATDPYGNEANSCVQTIYVYRNDASDIIWPSNYDGIDLQPLSCNQWKDEVPGPDVTGYPRPPSNVFCDNIQIFPHSDIKVNICEGSYKILRYWKLIEWCTGDILEYTQIIKVVDDRIQIICPQDEIEANEGTFSCSGFVILPEPTVINECSEWTYSVKWFVNENDPIATSTGVKFNSGLNLYTIEGLREGINVVQYTATDACGNEDVCLVEVNVEDNVNPTVVCDEFTTVSIAADGQAIVHASTFDDGSTDNCGIVYWEARKMSNSCASFNSSWHEDLIFCCEEIGTTVLVEFRVWDGSENSNSCMVEVTVEDKLPPYITKCPENITLVCTTDYTDLNITGEPEYVDNCEVVSVGYKDNINIDNCGEGTVQRVWTVKDAQGLKNSCTQVITLEDDEPFRYNDIRWPKDYATHGCEDSLHPDDLPNGRNYPTFNGEDACNLVASNYKDQVFSIVDSSCVKILRTWTVIDWCTYNNLDVENPYAEGIWQDVQILKLTNQEAPEFDSCNDFDVCAYDVCTNDPLVTLEQSATDDCTEQDDLYWSYEVDLWKDGLVNYTGHSNIVKKKMPYGTHKVRWAVEDKCGNVSFCEQEFEVKDCKKPTPYCIGEIVTTVMNNSGTVEIWASDFDLDSYDNCTAQEDLIFSFSASTSQSARRMVITCADIPNGEEEMIPVEIWVIDEAGNKDFCEVVLRVQDNESNICDPLENAGISGYVMNEDEEMLSGAMVTFMSYISEHTSQMMTANDGYYHFDVPLNYDYEISLEKADNPMNGVSTLDLLLIQRHILKLKKFDSPYKIIAADVDNSENIDASDLVQLRKLILGKVSSFPSTQSEWRFIDQNFEFDDVQNPFPFNELIDIDVLSSSMVDQNFIGVKIGDVDGNASVNITGNTSETRNRSTISLYTPAITYGDNEQIEIPIKLSDVASLSGMQFTINFDNKNMEYKSFKSGNLNLTTNNFGFNQLERSMITFSWNETNSIDLDADDVLFTLVFNTLESGNLGNTFELNSSYTTAEVYNADLSTLDINFNINNSNLQGETVLYQNTPNPFRKVTDISFFLSESSQAIINIYDVSGRLIQSRKGIYPVGVNKLSFDFTENNLRGVFYYQMSTDNYTATKKMIIIE